MINTLQGLECEVAQSNAQGDVHIGLAKRVQVTTYNEKTM